MAPEANTHDTAGVDRDYRHFWLAAAISNLGDGIRLAALPLLALQLTSDPRLIAGVTAASYLPWVLVGPLAGAIVDRRDRRVLMLAGQAARGLAVLVLSVAVATGRADVVLLYAVALAISTGETLVDSASQAAIPQLVGAERLVRANAQLNVAENLFNDVLGVALGALLFAGASSLPFFVDAATFGLGAALLATVRRPLQGARRPATTTLRADVAEGFRFLMGHPLLRGLAWSVAVTNVALHMGLGVLVVLVVREIGATDATFGTVLAIGAVGGVIGSLVAGRVTEWLTPRGALRVTHVPFVLSTLVFALATRTWMASLAFGLSSFALVVYQIPSRAIRQQVTPEHLLGRVVSAFRIFGLGGPVVGAPVGGVIAAAFGVRWAFVGSGIVMVVGWALVLLALRQPAPEERLAVAQTPTLTV